MKVLLIGYGSIGKRHFDILSDFDEVDSINVVTKQNIDNVKTFKSLKDIEDINVYDYFIIANETSKHYEQLDYVCKYTTNKNILVEKPLFDKEYTLESCDNNVFVAYNLRFHPLLQKLKEILKDEDVYYANVLAGQYLPTWRPDQDYRESYSAKLSQGGGVLRDLSHELDYINWIFGDITVIGSINTKISDLEIESDDIFTALAKTNDGTIINVTMDYISKMPLRKIMIHTKTKTIEANIVTNTINIFNRDGIENSIVLDKLHRDYTYTNMHKAIINNDFQNVCNLKEGLQTVDIIEKNGLKEM
ncbi:MAG TPA: Gfo/Idh/MocA family oxidoreductase, partial [Sulfurospirillum arcachonense]|nr:Gfo/Idh/MocA family oxidoreductase [Sulfurospirillum arcachonense]